MRSCGKRAVKRQVGGNTRIRPFSRAAHFIERFVHSRHVSSVVMHGGKARRLNLKRHSQLKEASEIIDIDERLRLYADCMTPVRLCHESPDALPGFDKPLITQLRNRFTHDGTTYREALREIVFGRQFCPGRRLLR